MIVIARRKPACRLGRKIRSASHRRCPERGDSTRISRDVENASQAPSLRTGRTSRGSFVKAGFEVISRNRFDRKGGDIDRTFQYSLTVPSMDAVFMATGDHLFQVLPVLFLLLERPAAAPGDPGCSQRNKLLTACPLLNAQPTPMIRFHVRSD
jgi:hypothetical protein